MSESPTIPAFTYAWGSKAELLDVVRPLRPTAEQLPDLFAIEQTIRAYGWAIDESRFDVLRDLFAPDAVFSGVIADVSTVEPVIGQDAITTWLQDYMTVRTDQLRHSMGNVLVTQLAGDRATALSYLTLHCTADGVTTVVATAFYHLALVRTGGAWRFRTVFAGFDKPF